MARPKSRRSRRRATTLKGGNRLKEPEVSLDELLAGAQSSLDEFDYETALQLASKAAKLRPDDVRVIEIVAYVYVETGAIEDAKVLLSRAIALRPVDGHAKFFTLAQFSEGQAALDLYRKGIDIVAKAISFCDHDEENEEDSESKRSQMSRELSNAYCSVAELYMTDLCDEEEAESNCNMAIDEAVRVDKNNPEAYVTKARLLSIKEEFEEAKEALRQSLSLWLPAVQAAIDNNDEDDNENQESPKSSLSSTPLYTSRLSCVRLLIDLEMWDEAGEVLETMLEEDEDVVDTWYLNGWLNYLRSKEEKEYEGNARFYFNKALETQAKHPTDDEAMIEHVKELLEELGPDDEEEEDPEIKEELEELRKLGEDEDDEEAMDH